MKGIDAESMLDTSHENHADLLNLKIFRVSKYYHGMRSEVE